MSEKERFDNELSRLRDITGWSLMYVERIWATGRHEMAWRELRTAAHDAAEENKDNLFGLIGN